MATNRSWTTADGQTKEEAQYHRIVAWQKLAELCGKLLTKGRKVYLEGRITYRSFLGKDNVQRTIAEIVLDDFIVFGDGRRATGEAVLTEEKAEEPIVSVEETVPVEQKNAQELEKKKEDESVSPDDIPF